MANVNGTLAGALILQRALQLTPKKYPILKRVSLGLKDLDGSISTARLNQPVITRLKAIPTVTNFPSASTDTADVDVSVTLDQFKQIQHTFTPAEYNATDRNLIDELAEPIAVAIGSHMVGALAARWIAANFTNSTIKASAWDYSTIRAIRKALSNRGVPKNWFGVVNADVYDALLGDTTIVAAMNNPANGNAIANGELPSVSGIELMEYPDLPTTGNMVGFFGSADSTVLAMRAPRDPSELLPGASFPGVLDYVTDEESGLSIMVNQWIGTDLSVNSRLCWIYGTAKGNGNNGQILKTS